MINLVRFFIFLPHTLYLLKTGKAGISGNRFANPGFGHTNKKGTERKATIRVLTLCPMLHALCSAPISSGFRGRTSKCHRRHHGIVSSVQIDDPVHFFKLLQVVIQSK
jgi:hypothetical protein